MKEDFKWERASKLVSLALILSASVALTGWWFVPVSSGFTKIWLLSSVAALWVGQLGLFWRRKAVRYLGLVVPVLVLGLLFLPGGQIDGARLRGDYVGRMKAFEGTEYHWGGEGRRGIDCSGLPRRAFRDAMIAEGLKHLDGRMLRSALEHWWFDASARAMMEGYRGYVTQLGISGTVRTIDETKLLPGDLAITADGVHVVVYVEKGSWIQADPGSEKVVTLAPATSDNGWFDKKVAMFRWVQLAD